LNKEKMRKLALLLLLCASSARAQVSVAQHKSALITTAGATQVTSQAASNVTANNYVYIHCAFYSSSLTLSASDSAGNTYSSDVGPTTNSTGPEIIQTFHAKITAGGGTQITFKCTSSAPQSNSIDIAWEEVSGADATTPTDSTTSSTPNPAGDTIFNAGTLTTSAANTLVLAACFPVHTITATGPGYTKLESTVDDLWTEVMATNTGVAGSYVPTFQDGSNADNDACNVVGIKAANQSTASGVYQGNGYGQFTNSNSTSRSWTHTVAGGSNRLLTVSLHYRVSQAGIAPTVTYNGASMSRTQLTCFNNGLIYCVDVFQLLSPTSGAHGVSVTYGTATDGAEGSEDFANVNQTTPITGIQTDVTASSGSSVTVTSTSGDWVSSRWTGQSGPTALCAASSTVQDYQKKVPLNGLWTGFGHAPGAASVTMNWTTSSTTLCPGTAIGDNHAHVAFDIQSATAPARTYPHRTRIM
jgi:hypothetical protein